MSPRCNELQLARSVGAEAALEALPVVAGELGVGPKLLGRLQKEYEEHAAVVMANDDDPTAHDLAERNELVRRVRLGVLDHQRRAVTALRNQNRIDDIVLRELQNELDLIEVQLLDPADNHRLTPRRVAEFMDCSGNRRRHIVDRPQAPDVLTLCALFRSPTSTARAPAACAPRWTGSAPNTAPPATKCF